MVDPRVRGKRGMKEEGEKEEKRTRTRQGAWMQNQARFKSRQSGGGLARRRRRRRRMMRSRIEKEGV